MDQREKYRHQPEKFEQSELNLLLISKEISTISAFPEQFPNFCEAGGMEILLQLVSHENTDISSEPIKALAELLDSENEITQLIFSKMKLNKGFHMINDYFKGIFQQND